MNSNLPQFFALIAAVGFAGMMGFQLLLVLGFPLGKAAWGGKYGRLPAGLRIGSAAAVVILLFAAISILEMAGLVLVFHNPGLVRIIVWIFTGFFALNTLGNFVSKSKWEKRIMTPAAFLLCVMCLLTLITSSP